MTIFKTIGAAIKAFNNTDKSKGTLRTAWYVYKMFGWSGLKKAVINKSSGVPLLEGLGAAYEEDVYSYHESYQGGEKTYPGDKTGRKIFDEQQNEFSELQYTEFIEKLPAMPLISIIIPLVSSQPEGLKATLTSIRGQYYAKWEIIAIDMGLRDGRCASIVRSAAEKDERIHLESLDEKLSKAKAYNLALQSSTGAYVAFVQQGDMLTPDALFWVAKAVTENPEVSFLYTDECCTDLLAKKELYKFSFKPEWSPMLMLNSNYIGSLSVFCKNKVDKYGGIRFDRYSEFDLALRLSEDSGSILHIERVLYQSSGLYKTKLAEQKNETAMIGAVNEYLQKHKYKATIYDRDGVIHVSKWRDSTPMASIVIPTDDEDKIAAIIPTLLRDTAYSNFEIIVVSNTELCENLKKRYGYLNDRLVLCKYDGIFNYSNKCNVGAKAAAGKYLIFLHEDTYPAQRDWLSCLLDTLDLPGVGAVSPAVLFKDGKIRYAGGQTSQEEWGICGPSFFDQQFLLDHRVIHSRLCRDVSVLCNFCIATYRDIFLELGGFDAEHTPLMYMEADYSFRIKARNLKCTYTASSILFFSSSDKQAELKLRDRALIYMIKRWRDELAKDSYFTRSMSRFYTDQYSLQFELSLPEQTPQGDKGNVLLISHELSRTGSPVVVFEAAKVLKDQGYFVVVASPETGPLAEDICKAGIPVLIDINLAKYRAYKPEKTPSSINLAVDKLLASFDVVIVASIVGHNLINCYNGSDTQILWWIHEGWTGFDLLKPYLPYQLSKNVSVYCGGKYAQNVVKKYRKNYVADVLLYGVKDRIEKDSSKLREKLLFLLPATFEKRKNQSLLIEAVSNLSEDSAAKAEFLLIGKIGEELYYKKLEQEAEKLQNVTLTGPVTYDRLMEIYSETTCVVVPSIDDPMPVVLAEAMMMSKVIICSNMTGTASYIEDGVNGFVFDSRKSRELTNKIEYIINNTEKIDDLRAAGRETYERYFSQQVFTQKLTEVVERNIKRFEEDFN